MRCISDNRSQNLVHDDLRRFTRGSLLAIELSAGTSLLGNRRIKRMSKLSSLSSTKAKFVTALAPECGPLQIAGDRQPKKLARQLARAFLRHTSIQRHAMPFNQQIKHSWSLSDHLYQALARVIYTPNWFVIRLFNPNTQNRMIGGMRWCCTVQRAVQWPLPNIYTYTSPCCSVLFHNIYTTTVQSVFSFKQLDHQTHQVHTPNVTHPWLPFSST